MTRIKDHPGIVEIIGLGMVMRMFYVYATTNKGKYQREDMWGLEFFKWRVVKNYEELSRVADLVIDRIKELEEWGEKE